jgi:hypothetical protein
MKVGKENVEKEIDYFSSIRECLVVFKFLSNLNMNIRLHNESQPFQAPKLQEKTNPHLHGKEDGEEAAASISI